MGQTRYYSLVFFDFGDDLSSPLNIQHEQDRFVVIDKQLYGLYNVFGNGVIDGWTVSDAGYTDLLGISVSISTGIGVIKYMAAETSLPYIINNLSPNSIVDIYARLSGATVRDRTVNFFASAVGLTSSTSLRLARVVTGDNNIVSIDNNVKDLIDFEEIIKDQINQHRHTGSPTKIDLQNEVKNQLPSARIESLDASKITSGSFDINRIPLIDHNQLENNGLLTHATLDTFIRTLSQSNKELLGEISSVNLLKTVVFLKYFYPSIDEHFINELVLIPGISPNSFIDFDVSTAHIDLKDRCISGIPSKVGIFTSIYWDDQYDFFNASYKNNVVVSDGKVTLEKTSALKDIIENFEYNISPGADIPGFTKDITSVEQNISLTSENSDSDKVEGDYSGKFSANTHLRVFYTKELSPSRNWSTIYDELVIWVKTINTAHESVYCYLINKVDEVEEIIGPFVLIDKDHVTANNDQTRNNFEEIIIDISSENLDNVTKFVVYTDELSNDFSFVLDNIHVRKENLYASNGSIKFRYNSAGQVTFHSIFYTSDIPDNTKAEVRIKIASSSELLARSSYSLPLQSGDVFALDGTAAEIEVVFTSVDRLSTPILSYIELRMLADADFSGFTIDTANEWHNGTLQNIAVTGSSSTADLILDSPVNVNGYYFGYNDSVSEMDDGNVGVFGFSGSNMPVAPNQAINWNNNPYHKFNFLTSVIRGFDKTFLIADTKNNRVLQVDENGNLVKGFASSYTVDDTFYPLCASYNPETYIVSIVFTKGVVVENITRISLYIGSARLNLTGKDEILTNQKSNSKVLEIKLHEDHWVQLVNITNNVTVDFSEGAFSEAIDISNNASKLIGLYGIECFIGDYSYIDNLNHPVFVDILDNNNWIVANSSIHYTVEDSDSSITASQEDATVPGILEFDPTTQSTIFSSSDVVFSDFTLGSISSLNEDTFIVACIKEGETITGGLTGEELLTNTSIITENVRFRAAALDGLTSYRGSIVIINKVSNKFEIFYNAPDGLYCSDVDIFPNGNLLVAESSFANSTGRLIKLDNYGSVTYVWGEGFYHRLNDAKVLSNNHMMVSV